MMILMVSLREREMIETDEGKGRVGVIPSCFPLLLSLIGT